MRAPQPPAAGIPTSRTRITVALAVSVVVHALLLAIALGRLHGSRAADEQQQRAAEQRQVEMVYIPPPPPQRRAAPAPKPAPEPKAPEPPPPEQPMQTRPPSEKPPQATPLAAAVRDLLSPRAEAPDAPHADDAGGDQGKASRPTEPPTPEPKPAQPAAAEAAAAPLTAAPPAPGSEEAEAQRLFGNHRGEGTPMASVSTRFSTLADASADAEASNCKPTPQPVGSAVEYGTATGRILGRDDGRPLAGAHLQMIGTPYNTFTDSRGWYVFKFDLSLVRNCRSQFVWVDAPGYSRQRLELMVGRNVQSDDVLLPRH